MFLFLSILEDSGYMARAAFVMDRLMRLVGLPGKSFVPMLVGFGCNVPAIMATRTLENPRDRLMTILMNPFMSCGARLPVYALFAAAFFPVGGQNIVFGLYLLGIAAAIFTGIVMKNTLLKVLDIWKWEKTWGWDFPLTAMAAARLNMPEQAVDALLMPVQKNTYLKNGHNYQDERLTIYLPGNGGFLSAVAMMCTGVDGSEEGIGFPKNKNWNVRWEGLHKMF
jgi:hypothetical protein